MNTVSAFDSSTMQNDTRSVVDGTESDVTNTKTGTTGTSTVAGTTTGMENGSSEDSRTKADVVKTTDSYTSDGSVQDNETEASANKHKGRTHGNIGVTTSQQMLTQEWEVAKLNIYEEAADLFLSEFTIFIY